MSEGGRRWTASRSVIASPNQPAQSPDLNCLDLGLFASIQSVQSRTTSCTIQDIIQEVEHACEIMTAETLNKTFLTLPLVMKEIMNCEGRNDYKLAHFHKDKLIRAGKLPASLQCDTTSFGLAQQSILALAVASWIDPPLPQASTQPSPRSPPLSPPSPTHFDPFLYF
ncbi:hypothetical protein F441_06135 [Phytophthora nicotianae CJ01A1]|uniref:Uncharacterized protein n=2 Tax=Phytophthora nicotianae TaxID=4792 RepID=W2RAA8_PHYN3|nr:hypothetical protein PPTG_02262 [Phytophthora nicotianae INRA-310]ETN22282.1 hypothetical protein PPTG_02262 [Phytophthora nicotianae INRA-310]ETP20026.1 hypothetical protein F441_06135 [Phytophthora nicotianae CJ01A1]